MTALPVPYASSARPVAPARPATGGARAAQGVTVLELRPSEPRPVEAASAPVTARPRDDAAALLLFLARDQVAETPSAAPSAQAQRASEAYRRQGGLPALYDEGPVVFSIRA